MATGKYVAAVDFIDLEDDNYYYRAGEKYPRPGLKPTKKRVEVLSTNANKMGYPLITTAEKPETQE